MAKLASGWILHSDSGSEPQSIVVTKHAQLVKRIAQHLLGRLPPSVQLEDLIQAGMIGLLEASKNYDFSKGASFETYASIRIRGSMLDEIRKGDLWKPMMSAPLKPEQSARVATITQQCAASSRQ